MRKSSIVFATRTYGEAEFFKIFDSFFQMIDTQNDMMNGEYDRSYELELVQEVV